MERQKNHKGISVCTGVQKFSALKNLKRNMQKQTSV
jgi:hypothetical protein